MNAKQRDERAQESGDPLHDAHGSRHGDETPETSIHEPKLEPADGHPYVPPWVPLQNAIEKARPGRVRGLLGLVYVALLLLLVLVGLAFIPGFFGSDDQNDAATEPAATEQSATQAGDAAPEEPEVVDGDDTTPLSGTWAMFWRNKYGDESVAFTLRFSGSDTGTLEVLNDENESETWFELDGDALRFGFTRTFQPPSSWPAGSPFPVEGWPENSVFEGTLDSDERYMGTWYRDDWECQPDASPPCWYNDTRTSFVAWLEPEAG